MSELEVAVIMDRAQKIFRAGDRLWGKVMVSVRRQTNIRGVQVKITGRAVIAAKGQKNNKERPEIRNEENYCEYSKLLWGRSLEKAANPDDALEILEEGRHYFPFLYKLPESCPCSFRGKFGSVEYVVDCSVVDRENFCHQGSQPFLVVRDLDLLRYQQPVQQTKIEKEIAFSKLRCISMGVLDCRIVIAKRAFVPGERVKVDVEVENHTGKKIRDISMMLRQNIIYRLDDGSVLSEDRSVYDFNFGTVRESTTTQWKDHQFKIPVVPPSNLEGCSLIDIIYIMALVRVKSPSVPLVSTHITIGTVPSTGKKSPMKWKYSEPCFLPPGIKQRPNALVPVYKVFYQEPSLTTKSKIHFVSERDRGESHI